MNISQEVIDFGDTLQYLADKFPEVCSMEYGGEFPDGSNYLFTFKHESKFYRQGHQHIPIHIPGETSVLEDVECSQDQLDYLIKLLDKIVLFLLNPEDKTLATIVLNKDMVITDYIPTYKNNKLEALKIAFIEIVKRLKQ
jgi:hypothetical protein